MRKFESADENPDISFDQNLADSYIGKTLLFGITSCDHDENVLAQEQNYGEILEINARVMVVKIHDSGEKFTLPPFVNDLESAPEGEYRLRSTGEIVVNPDLLGRFQFIAPAPKASRRD